MTFDSGNQGWREVPAARTHVLSRFQFVVDKNRPICEPSRGGRKDGETCRARFLRSEKSTSSYLCATPHISELRQKVGPVEPVGAEAALYTDEDKVFCVKRMWAEGLTPTAASRLWGAPSRRTLAAWEKCLPAGSAPVVHTDGGACYRTERWKSALAAAGASRSMSRKGTCPDNARAEGFFGTLKQELLASMYFSPFSPTYFHQSHQRGCTRFTNADAPLSAPRRPSPPSRPRRLSTRPSGGTTAPLP